MFWMRFSFSRFKSYFDLVLMSFCICPFLVMHEYGNIFLRHWHLDFDFELAKLGSKHAFVLIWHPFLHNSLENKHPSFHNSLGSLHQLYEFLDITIYMHMISLIAVPMSCDTLQITSSKEDRARMLKNRRVNDKILSIQAYLALNMLFMLCIQIK